MRLIFTLFLFVTLNVFAQQPIDYIKQVKEIALMERLGHENLSGAETLTLASTNFDVKYYRCEWEVDPAISFITGKVTMYYIITTAATDISLDIMNPLIVDSVKQRNNLLTKHTGQQFIAIKFCFTR